MTKLKGIDIKEVWNSRLSTATPLIDRRGGTWVCQVWAKDNPDYDPNMPETLAVPLEEYGTDILYEDGDEHNKGKLKKCFAWFREVREKYSLADLEERKPVVALIEDANATAGRINQELAEAQRQGDGDTVREKQGALRAHLIAANAEIKKAVTAMHTRIVGPGAPS